MGFIKFVFVLMLLVPIVLLMWYLLNKLSDDMKAVARKAAEEDVAARQRAKEVKQDYSRHYTPGYNNTQATERVPYRNPYEGRTFGSTAAEIERRQQEEKVREQKEIKHKTASKEISNKELSKRQRRKARKNRKKGKEQ